MKGLELEVLLGLIFVVIILLVIAIIVVNPVFSFGEDTGNQIDFRQFCIYWGVGDYREGKGQNVIANNEIYPVNENCATALGKPPDDDMSNWDIDNCRNLCKAKI
ncbi:MAG: hypothetical protein ABIE55_04475 [Candidatus Aenigmatarchaeota archaeon]